MRCGLGPPLVLVVATPLSVLMFSFWFCLPAVLNVCIVIVGLDLWFVYITLATFANSSMGWCKIIWRAGFRSCGILLIISAFHLSSFGELIDLNESS